MPILQINLIFLALVFAKGVFLIYKNFPLYFFIFHNVLLNPLSKTIFYLMVSMHCLVSSILKRKKEAMKQEVLKQESAKTGTSVLCSTLMHLVIKGLARGKGGESLSPRNRKYCCRKMGVFPKALFLGTNFRKNKTNKKIQFFYRIFIKKFQNFVKISQQFGFFVQMRKELTQFVKLLEKYAKIVHLLLFSEENLSKLSKIFSQFPINCLFRPNAHKINAGLLNFRKIC